MRDVEREWIAEELRGAPLGKDLYGREGRGAWRRIVVLLLALAALNLVLT